MGEIVIGIIVTIASAAIITVVGYLLTSPRIRLLQYSKESLEIFICKEDDMTINSTSGRYEISWQAAKYGIQQTKNTDFAYIVIENKPFVYWSENSTAKGVSVEIECTEIVSNRKIPRYYARPKGTPAPFTKESYGLYEAARVDIPPGSPRREFYIAFHDPDEACFYGFSNTSYTYYHKIDGSSEKYFDWKNPKLKMDNGDYRFKMKIGGDNIKPKTYELIIGQDLEIKKRIK